MDEDLIDLMDIAEAVENHGIDIIVKALNELDEVKTFGFGRNDELAKNMLIIAGADRLGLLRAAKVQHGLRKKAKARRVKVLRWIG